MKHLLKVAAVATLLAFAAPPAFPQENHNGDEDRISGQIRELNRQIYALKLKRNRLLWKSYIEQAKQSKTNIPIYGLKTFDAKLLQDTIPELGAMRSEWEKNNEYIRSRVDRDRIYRRLKRYANKYPNKETFQEALNSRHWDVLRKDPRLTKLNEENYENLNMQNIYISEILLEHYTRIGEIMPEDIIPANIVRRFDATLEGMQITDELQVLQSAKSHLTMKLREVKIEGDRWPK